MSTIKIEQRKTYNIEDDDSGVGINVRVEMDADDDMPVGIAIDDPSMDTAQWISVEHAEGLIATLIAGITERRAALGEVGKYELRFDLPAGHPNSAYAPASTLRVDPDYYSVQSALQDGRDMTAWNEDALIHAGMTSEDVTFLYQGERDTFPRQRVVGYVELDENDFMAHDREAADQIKCFRLDRIKSHVLVIKED